MRFFSPLLILAALLAAACGGAAVLPDEFTRERADGKIPVSIELIRQQTKKEIDGMPEEQAKVERWQLIETDYNACRLSSSRKTKADADKVFADCMSRKGYLYMHRLDAEQLHNDIAEKVVAEHKAAERAGEEARLAAEKKATQKQKDSGVRYWSQEGGISEVREWLDFGANPNAARDDGVTALMLAAQRGHSGIIKMLLVAGANPNAVNNAGVTALILATDNGHAEVVKMLLDAGANLNGANDTVLMFAADDGHVEVIKILLDAGANPNAVRDDGWTALIFAAQEGRIEITKMLLAAGANPNAVNNAGVTALMFAALEGAPEVAKILLVAGANPNDRNNNGWTALLLAANEEKPEVVKILLACGANPDIENKHGADTWFWAKRHPIILPILEEYREKVAAGWKPKSCKHLQPPQPPKKPAAKPKETA